MTATVRDSFIQCTLYTFYTGSDIPTLPDYIAISRDIANCGYNVNFWSKRWMLDLLNPKLMIYLWS